MSDQPPTTIIVDSTPPAAPAPPPAVEAAPPAAPAGTEPASAPTETPAAAAPETEQEKLTAARLARLTAQERKIQQEKRELKEKLEKVQAWEAAQALKTEKPLEFLKTNGLDLDTLINRHLDELEAGIPKEKTATELVDEKIQAFKSDFQQQQEELQKQQAISTYIKSIDQVLSKDPDRYELTISEGSPDLVWSVLEKDFEKKWKDYSEGRLKEEPVALTFEQAADEVEQYFHRVNEEKLKRISSYKKFAPTQSTPETKSTKQGAPKVTETVAPVEAFKPSVRLTNQNTPIPTIETRRSLTDEERFKQAASLIKFK